MKENRYLLPTDKLVNRLVPHYLGGRKYILFLQSLVYPLKPLNERFRAFAKEKHIAARMTSQVLYFEWYLNYKFGKYLQDTTEKIALSESSPLGADLYHENSLAGKPFTLWFNPQEWQAVADEREKPREFYYRTEEKSANQASFMVLVPEITIGQREFVQMLSFVVNTYKTAGKTYMIKITDTETRFTT